MVEAGAPVTCGWLMGGVHAMLYTALEVHGSWCLTATEYATRAGGVTQCTPGLITRGGHARETETVKGLGE